MALNSASRGNPSLSSEAHDPVRETLSWQPLTPGGASFKTHRLELAGQTLQVKALAAQRLFGYLFVLLGLIGCLWMGIVPLTGGAIANGLVGLLAGGLFVLIGIFAAYGGDKKLLTFDKVSRRYFDEAHRDDYSPVFDRTKAGSLAAIYALQVLSEEVTMRDDRHFTSFELNLVFHDGERVTVMDHGHLGEIKSAAATLGRFLNVPVWVAPWLASRNDPPARNVGAAVVFFFIVIVLGGLGVVSLISVMASSPTPRHSPEAELQLERLPEGLLNPEFCTFDKVTSGFAGEKIDLWGTMSLPIMSAGDRVHAVMRMHPEWEPDGVIKQADAAALMYLKDNIKAEYLFLVKPQPPNGCVLSWHYLD